jgi:hypothetical protein
MQMEGSPMLDDPSVGADVKARIRHLFEVTLTGQSRQSIGEGQVAAARYVLDATNNDVWSQRSAVNYSTARRPCPVGTDLRRAPGAGADLRTSTLLRTQVWSRRGFHSRGSPFFGF